MSQEIWWTAPTESENGKLIMVTGRKDVDKFRNNPKFNIRIEVTWKYGPTDDGMPDKPTSEEMERVQDALADALVKNKVAVLTGIYTGDGERNWIFYSFSTNLFGRRLNDALAEFPLLPLTIYCENDAAWAEYDEMSQVEINVD